MSFSGVARMPDLVIPIGTAVSNTLNAKDHYEDAAAIALQCPTLDALTFRFEVSIDGTTFVDYQEGATLADVTIPATGGHGAVYDLLCAWPYFRIAASGNVAAERTFMVAKHFTMR